MAILTVKTHWISLALDKDTAVYVSMINKGITGNSK